MNRLLHLATCAMKTHHSGQVFTTSMKSTMVEYDYNRFAQFVAQPVIVKQKIDAELIAFYGISSKPELSPSGVRRIKENITSIDVLMLDIDSGCTMEEYCSNLDRLGFEYHAYSTFSSKPGFEKFRVMLPMASNMPAYHLFTEDDVEELCIRKFLFEKFSFGLNGLDEVSFRVPQFFFSPSKSKNNDNYKSISKPGRPVEPNDMLQAAKVAVASEVLGLRLKRLQRVSNDVMSSDAFKKAVMKRTLEKLDTLSVMARGSGEVHTGLLKAVRNLFLNDFTREEIWQLLSPYEMRFGSGELAGIIK